MSEFFVQDDQEAKNRLAQLIMQRPTAPASTPMGGIDTVARMALQGMIARDQAQNNRRQAPQPREPEPPKSDMMGGGVTTMTPQDDINMREYARYSVGAGGDPFGGGVQPPGAPPAGAKVICTELYRQGLMDEPTYRADQEFGADLAVADPDAMRGYLAWAPAVVDAMRRSPKLSRVIALIAMPWAEEMAYRMGERKSGSVIGYLQMEVGLVICRALGRRIPVEA